MSNEKSTEEQVQKIDAIVGNESLGYTGSAHEEHSGEHSEKRADDDGLSDQLADNRAGQMS